MLKNPLKLNSLWNSDIIIRLIECCEMTEDFAMAAFYTQCRTPINYSDAFRFIDSMSLKTTFKLSLCALESGSDLGLFWDANIIEKVIGKQNSDA